MQRTVILISIWLLCLAGMGLIALRMLYAVWTAPYKAWSIAVSVDDTANVAGNGRLGQTISARAAQSQREGRRWGCILCHWLDLVDRGHCDRALTDGKQNLKD